MILSTLRQSWQQQQPSAKQPFDKKNPKKSAALPGPRLMSSGEQELMWTPLRLSGFSVDI